MERFISRKVAVVIFLVFMLALGAATELYPQSLYAQTPGVQQLPPTPQELFASLSRSIFVIEVLDEAGAVIAQGSGVAISENRVVTNKHVVIEGASLRVRQGGDIRPAIITQLAPNTDLSLLEVRGLNATVLPPVRPLESLTIGERVYAIGAPRGLELTLSDGLVSGIRQDSTGPVIQTTAPISPGSSGGGLFDAVGRLVGITTFALRNSQGLNFAVPADVIFEVIRQPQLATAEAWVAAADQLVESAFLTGPLQAPPPPTDPVALARFGEDFRRRMEPIHIQWRKAIRAYQKALALESGDSAVWVKLGTLYAKLALSTQRTDDKEKATEAFRAAINLEPDDASIWTKIADGYETIDDTQNALNAYKEALRINPNDAYLWVRVAAQYDTAVVLQRLRGEMDKSWYGNQRQLAIEALNQAEALKPSSAGVWFSIGQHWNGFQKYKEAEAAFQKAINLDPQNSSYLYILGDFYLARRDRSKVRQIYERLKVLDPVSAEVLLQLLR